MGTGDQGVDVAVVCYFNPADTPGGSERIAWAEAELLSRRGRVVFISASPAVARAAFPQLRMGGWALSLRILSLERVLPRRRGTPALPGC
jgi:hypothetical protein